ncbi:MAG: anaerobic ribonucleoside-triphosphate reductase activating protein [Armatimonadota bacterium]|nr:anaerobic ribonucleoside-triphosphate reductase activating protein [Armatimonadota bacterium]
MEGEHPPARERARLRVGGFEPLTTVEWEGRLSAVVFLQGCPWRCRYCHNSELAPLTAPGMRPWAEIFEELRARQGFIDAVIFSGGEPTLQSELPQAMREVAALGFEVALHTNGFDPQALAAVLQAGAADFVAMDVKAPFEEYELITQVPRSGLGARDSVGLLLESGLEHELRTTYHPALLTHDHLRQIARTLSEMGVERWVIQLFRPEGCPVRWLRESIALPAEVGPALRQELASVIGEVHVRGDDE